MNRSKGSLWVVVGSVASAVAIVLVLDLLKVGPPGSEWLSAWWYIGAALVGLFVGGPVARGLRPKNYTGEQPPRMTGTGMGQ